MYFAGVVDEVVIRHFSSSSKIFSTWLRILVLEVEEVGLLRCCLAKAIDECNKTLSGDSLSEAVSKRDKAEVIMEYSLLRIYDTA